MSYKNSPKGHALNAKSIEHQKSFGITLDPDAGAGQFIPPAPPPKTAEQIRSEEIITKIKRDQERYAERQQKFSKLSQYWQEFKTEDGSEPFKVTSSMARNIAETMWGRGGTTARKTNRPGVYYYSCASHGGYVVDPRALTEDERKRIDQYIEPEGLEVCAMLRNDGSIRVLKYKAPNSRTRSQCSYVMADGDAGFYKYPLYTFEEDLEWAILESQTDIHTLDVTPDRMYERKKIAQDTLFEWFDPNGPRKTRERQKQAMLDSGAYLQGSAMSKDRPDGTNMVKVIFRNKDGDDKAYWMAHETYDKGREASPFMATIEDFAKIGPVTQAKTAEFYGQDSEV